VKLWVQGELSTTARDPVVTDALVSWVSGLKGAPFYAHLHLMSPHHPYDPPAPFDRFVPDRSHKPVTYYPKKSYFFFEQGAPLDQAALDDMVARYDGDILFVDGVFAEPDGAARHDGRARRHGGRARLGSWRGVLRPSQLGPRAVRVRRADARSADHPLSPRFPPGHGHR
jgi:hypothetical protein